MYSTRPGDGCTAILPSGYCGEVEHNNMDTSAHTGSLATYTWLVALPHTHGFTCFSIFHGAILKTREILDLDMRLQ